jgi:capsule polysaccharide export protein KpsE/RkpR
VDTSELIRVFGILSHVDGALAHETESQYVQDDVSESAGGNVGALKAEIEGLKAVVDAQKSHIASLESAMRLLGHSAEHAETLPRPWWKFWG